MSAFLRRDKTGRQPVDSDGHVLTELWADFGKAVLQDRPKRQADILLQIREQAMEQHIAYDFYDASKHYVEAGADRNWKLRDTLNSEFAENVMKFGEPVVTFVWMAGPGDSRPDSVFRFVQANSKALKSGHNQPFYKIGGGYFGSLFGTDAGFLKEFYANDYEYALWRMLFSSSRRNVTEGRIYEALKDYEGGSYPLGAYLEYLTVKVNADVSDDKKLSELQSFADKYDGKAVSLFAKADILAVRFHNMLKDKKMSSTDYEKFYNECQAFEKERNAFHGSEARIAKEASGVESIIAELTDKGIDLDIRNGKIVVVLKNLDKAHLTMKLGNDASKALIDKVLKNDVRSFFVGDTLKLAVPELNDGEYVIYVENDKAANALNYSSFRISLASRADSRGLCIYAADYKSGEPLNTADLELKKNGKTVAAYKGFRFNGFTPLPEEISSRLKGNAYYALSCSFVDESGWLHKSRDISLRGKSEDSAQPAGQKDTRRRACNIYTDRGAYNPGDTVDFKAVIYYTDFVNSAEVSPSGAKYKVVLVNAEGNEVDSRSLMTNEFGSIAGQFVLPEDGRNGYYRIEVVSDPEYSDGIFSKSFRVDDFVLPTFDVTFDKAEKLYLPGDEVCVTGRVTSYTGHPVSSAKAVYEVESYGRRIAAGALTLPPDGSFSVGFGSDKDKGWSSYRVTVRIADDTGETHEYGKSVWVTGAVNVNASLVNAAEGNVSSIKRAKDLWEWIYAESPVILRENTASVKLSVDSRDGVDAPVQISYCVENESGEKLSSESVPSGTVKDIDMSALASGLYSVKAKVSVRSAAGKEYKDSTTLKFILVRDSDKVLDAPVKDLISPVKTEVNAGGRAELLFGTADGAPVWALAEVFGKDAMLLETRMVRLSGVRGKEGSLERVSFDYKDEYPDAIRVQVFYFKDSRTVSCGYEFHRVRTERVLPLEFSSFEDRTLPSSVYTFSVRTSPNVECLAAVFDKSTETIASNVWNTFRLSDFHPGCVNVDARPGSVGGGMIGDGDFQLDEVVVTGYGVQGRRHKSNGLYSRAAAPMMMEGAVSDSIESDAAESENEPAIRERFANALTFQPFLRSDKDGNLSFSFSTSDKLSTYIVSLYAHDRQMRNSTLRREMMVTIPVKVNLVEPKYLYMGDTYRLAVSVSSVADKPVSGTLTLYIYNGRDYKELAGVSPLASESRHVTVPAGESVRSEFEVDAAALLRKSAFPADLGFKVVFVADKNIGSETGASVGGFSDGMFVSVPVYPAVQTLTESHSAVLLSGMDKNALVEKLRGEFVNVHGLDADIKTISIMDMVRECIPSKVEPDGKDVLSLSEAMYVRNLSYQLRGRARVQETDDAEMSDEELFRKVLACHNADGGFAWFEGMTSSPVITAVLLERFSKMLAAGLIDNEDPVSDDAASCADVAAVLASAVRYLDKEQFSASDVCPLWCGGVSDAQYMYVRSMFSSIPFDVESLTSKDIDKRLKSFRKEAKAYLVPVKARGLNGYILGKARRLAILRNLAADADGIALAKAWGLGINIDSRLSKSVEADVVSLLEYAVEHKDGGVYYPNLVMPFRGLLESEAYAHSMLCDLFTAYTLDASSSPAAAGSVNVKEALRVADGIRLWLMLQKETQHWDAEPAFVDAVNSVMSGSPAVKSTSVVTLSKSYSRPFSEIKAAGNGFTIERRLFREVASVSAERDSGEISRVEIRPGEMLNVGDKIIAEYRIHNDENRSFVRLTVPREAAFRPADQLSGRYGWWMSPLRVAGWYTFAPQGYRDVKPDRTEYMFDSYPEENTVISEELFVTQAGTFSAPVPVIESLYAPHYRANASFAGAVVVE